MAEPDLAAAALAVLRDNWRGGHTVPSRRLYPHQWSWDSAFTAIGWAHAAPRRARTELESLLAAQWSDGRVPQIVFSPSVPRDAYFPGPDFWRARSPSGAETTGLVQPPLHARAAWEVHRADPRAGARFLRRVYPALVAQHEYLRRERSDDAGLAVVLHPWETGLDNSPAWDAELARVPAGGAPATGTRRDLGHVVAAERPTQADYARYLALAARYRDAGYRDAVVRPDHPFSVTDPLFNAVLGWSEEALADIAGVVGAPVEPHRRRAAEIRDALLARHLDPVEGTFHARLGDGSLDREHTVGGLVPLVLDLPPRVVDGLVRELTGPRFALDDRGPLPSSDRTGDAFDPSRYWRGPAWVNTSWLVWRGLRRHGRVREAATLRAGVLAAVRAGGFREYFDPTTGEGRGAADFGWSAALALDLLAAGDRAGVSPSPPRP